MASKPGCFGDDSQYTETSAICRACGWRKDCSAAIDAKANNTYYHHSSWASKSNKTTAVSKKTAPSAVLPVINSAYNHNKPLAGQFMRHLGYSVVEVTLTEGLGLVRSMRDNYIVNNMKDTTEEN